MTNALLKRGQIEQQNKAYPKLEFNPNEHRDDLKELDLTREQEDELLQALWQIISTIVDMGWGIETTQIVLQHIFEHANDNERK